jgi:hypothetical protein
VTLHHLASATLCRGGCAATFAYGAYDLELVLTTTRAFNLDNDLSSLHVIDEVG